MGQRTSDRGSRYGVPLYADSNTIATEVASPVDNPHCRSLGGELHGELAHLRHRRGVLGGQRLQPRANLGMLLMLLPLFGYFDGLAAQGALSLLERRFQILGAFRDFFGARARGMRRVGEGGYFGVGLFLLPRLTVSGGISRKSTGDAPKVIEY
jgi:hypothetical protein